MNSKMTNVARKHRMNRKKKQAQVRAEKAKSKK